MGRSRRVPFRAWGLVLTAAFALTAWRQEWVLSAWSGGLLLLYLLFVRRTRCRTETTRGAPCLKLARGFLRACDLHSGLKRGLPSLVGTGGLPMFMWRRPQFDVESVVLAQESVPVERKVPLDRIMMWLAVGSLAVACASFVRDLVAG